MSSRYFSAKEKLKLIKKAKAGRSVVDICKQAGISRAIFYRWLKRYNEASPRKKTTTLSFHVKAGKEHYRYDQKREQEILDLALKNPSYSLQDIARMLKMSPNGVWMVLKRHNLNTRELREQRIQKHGNQLFPTLTPEEKLQLIKRHKAGESVVSLCKEHSVSRALFYRWLKRYEQAQEKISSLENQRPKGERHWRYVHEAPGLILNLVVTQPEYTGEEISHALEHMTGRHILSRSSVYDFLSEMQLSTSEQRLAYAQAQAIPIPEAAYRPEWKLPVALLLGFFGLLLIFVSVVAQGQTLVARIGLFFSFLALTLGSIFFLYSLKYYVTIAIILSFSRNQQSQPTKRGIGAFLQSLFGISIEITDQNPVREPQALLPVNSLQVDLSTIQLERTPFISIHVATYNEKRVIDRFLLAATAMDYPNYEVIVADDSTDETVTLLEQWKAHPRVKISHRTTREGYKGAALQAALSKTDPRAEFILVFDADFIPFPDAITQFLKYFQGTLGNLQPETIKRSRVAAVQGYQWHILNKSENWITRGVRTEYAGSYVIERSGTELYRGLKQISGSVYMIRKDVLQSIGWGRSITEDFELTLRLYEQGYKVVYTPYIQTPAEAVSTIKRLIRQRMRWAEGHSFNVKRMFKQLLFSPSLSHSEKFEFLYLVPYYLQAFFFILGTACWFLSEVVFRVRLPFWTETWGWSLVLTNVFALPLMNLIGLFLEQSDERDYLGLLSFIILSYIIASFQAFAAVKGFLEREEGPWFRTPKTGRITDSFLPGRISRFVKGLFGGSPIVAESKAYTIDFIPI